MSRGNCGKNDCFQVTRRWRCGSIPAMDIQDFARSYAAKTDEELLLLAGQRSELTVEACAALAGELTRRRIEVSAGAMAPEEDSVKIKLSSKGANFSVIHLPIGEFIEEVLRFYNRNRWTFIRIVFPAVLVGYISVMLARHETRLIARHLDPSFPLHRLNSAVWQIQAVSSASYVVSWMGFCVAFGAICSAVEQVSAGFEVSVNDPLAAVRERLGPFLRLSALLLFVFFALEVIFAALILEGIMWVLRSWFGDLNRLTISVLVYALFALAVLILSRFGLAMPALILDDYPVGRAMIRSDELTHGRWSILGVLLFKSIVGGYFAGMLPFWLARWILAGINLPAWFQWVLAGASVGAVTIVEPIMFIGLALLYLKTSAAYSVSEAQATTA